MALSEAWPEIRGLRAVPPGLAASDDARRETFNAALQQAQELAHASDAVGYAAKPLPLFYSLSQAGRAMRQCGWQVAIGVCGDTGSAHHRLLAVSRC